MGLWENFKTKREAKKKAEIKAEITKIENEKGKKLNEKGKEKVTKNVEAKRKRRGIRNTFLALLGSVGIVVGGNALLTSGNQPETGEKQTDTKTEVENKENTSTNKKEAYLKELQNMDLYDQTDISQEKISNANIIDEIQERYNDSLPEQEKIDKDDLGIIKQAEGTVGQIIEDTSGEKVKYIKEPKSVGELQEGQTHIDDQVKDGYYLVNNNNNETIAGVIEIADGYYEIRIDYASIKDANGEETIYTKNPDTYVELEELFNDQIISGEIDWKTIGEAFENYYKERLSNLTNERNADGFEH